MSEWISVKDRLPPQDGTPFLCYDPKQLDNFSLACIYVVHFEKETSYLKEGYIEAGGECYFRWEPTHWMPLPEPPMINLVNEDFFFLEDGTALRRDEYCSKCKNEWVACVCMNKDGYELVKKPVIYEKDEAYVLAHGFGLFGEKKKILQEVATKPARMKELRALRKLKHPEGKK